MANKEITYLILFGLIVFTILLIFDVIILMTFYRKNRTYRTRLLEFEHEKQQEVLKAQLEIQEQTLKTISQEIHDNIGQVLSLAKLNINTINLNDPEACKEKIADSRQLVSKAILDLRNLSKVLDTDYVIEKGLLQSIEHELEMIGKTGSFKTEFLITGEPYRLNEQKELILFRVFQEMLNNIIKHARATQIIAELSYLADNFVMKVTDNGTGFDLAPLNETNNNLYGLGIKSMHNRARLLGATFTMQSNMGSGTSVQVILPKSPSK